MSVKERRRLVVLGQGQGGLLRLRAAAGQLGLSYRQARRVYRRLKVEGDRGLVHRLRGRPGNRGKEPALRQGVVELYRQRYGDFGCTLACEHLAEDHGLVVDDQTLRRWLTAARLWRRRRRGGVKRRRRQRRPCFGELVQIDGSHHDWFEGRGPHTVLMVMVDDATGYTDARFCEAETTQAAMRIFERWALRHGLPGELYPDRDSIYRRNDPEADAIEARTGRRPLTQLGRALAELGVALTCAKTPQAKGRVERMNGTLQDRLVKELRLAGIGDLAAANEFLDRHFLPRLNERFTVEPACVADVHRPVSQAELTAALCVKEDRGVGRDQCVSWQGQVLQLLPGVELPSLAGKRVTLRQHLDATITVQWQGTLVPHRPLAARPRVRPATPTLPQRLVGQAPTWKPPTDHPWRRFTLADKPLGCGCATVSAPPRPALRRSQGTPRQGTVLLRQ